MVESNFYELQDVLGGRRQVLASSPTMSALSVDAEMGKRVDERLQDEGDGEVYEEIIQLHHNDTRESRHHS